MKWASNLEDPPVSEPIDIVEALVVQPSALEKITRAEIDIQISTAKRYPRDMDRFIDQATSLATKNERIAATMGYAVPRGGKTVEGPSVRMAEILAHSYKNIRVGAFITDISDKMVTARGFCHDLENNVAVTSEVQRRLTDKEGKRYNDDMITTTCNAACAIARRNAVLQVIPRSYISPIYDAAMKVAEGEGKPLEPIRDEAVKLFEAKWGINKKVLLSYLDRKGIEAITREDVRILHGLNQSLREGQTTTEEVFAEHAAPKKKARTAKGSVRTTLTESKPFVVGDKKLTMFVSEDGEAFFTDNEAFADFGKQMIERDPQPIVEIEYHETPQGFMVDGIKEVQG
jgi:hypothetical protein